MKKTTIPIVIVSWNTKDLLEKCLHSIKQYQSSLMLETWVVDNHSKDGSAQMVKKKFPLVHLIANTGNKGFAKANNQVLRTLKSEYVLILNPDTELLPGCIESMLKILRSDETIAICGPKMLNPDRSVQHLGFYRRQPSLWQTVLFYTDLHRISEKIPWLVHKFWESDIEKPKVQSVDQIPGACMLAKREILEQINFFHERYPLWFEDVDLCFVLRHRGYKLCYVPDSQIIHVGGAAFDQWSDRERKETRFWKSLFTFFDLNYPIPKPDLVRIIVYSSLLFMVGSRRIMQWFGYNEDRQKFIDLKWNILKALTVNSLLKSDYK